jgi:hypothetical protein
VVPFPPIHPSVHPVVKKKVMCVRVFIASKYPYVLTRERARFFSSRSEGSRSEKWTRRRDSESVGERLGIELRGNG